MEIRARRARITIKFSSSILMAKNAKCRRARFFSRPDQGLPSPGHGIWVVGWVEGKGFAWVPVAPAKPEQPLPTPPQPAPKK